MSPRRVAPRVGMGVTVALLARRLRGTVEEVRDGGRTLMVLTEDGETMEFALSRATGYFTRDGVQSGARLMFDEPDG